MYFVLIELMNMAFAPFANTLAASSVNPHEIHDFAYNRQNLNNKMDFTKSVNTKYNLNEIMKSTKL